MASSGCGSGARFVPIEHREVRGAETPRFLARSFLEQTVYQLAFPFSVPLVALTRGRAAITNMRFNCYRKDAPAAQGAGGEVL
jgi:hypothetical protein